MDGEKKRVLICPLGWGLGHASRDIPIIESFLKAGHEVIVAGDNQQMSLLTQHFSGIKAIHFPSFKVKLSKGRSQLWPLIRIASLLPFFIIKEHFLLKRLIKKHQIDIVVSDNRYGLWNRHVKTIFITHQLKIFFPRPFRFLEPIGERFIRYFVKKFDECWIPDFSGKDNLAGELSHPSKIEGNVQYVGLLSRFSKLRVNTTNETYDLVCVASGPSPQREMFIEEIAKLAHIHSFKTLIIMGDPEIGTNIKEVGEIQFVGHLNDSEFASIVKSAKNVICRAGYSTIMDMIALGVSPIIVPTPGQTEQEYLLKHISNKKIMFGVPQESILQLCKQECDRKDKGLVKFTSQITDFSF